MITRPLKRHAAISGCFAIPALIVAVLVAIAVGAYAIPEAWSAAVANRDALTFCAAVLFGCIVVAWFGAPGAVAAKDAVDKYSEALEYDKHTRRDDRLSYLDQNGKRHTGALYHAMDSGPQGPGVYRQIGETLTLLERFSEYEAEQRRIQNDGGFGGYNEAVNEGRR